MSEPSPTISVIVAVYNGAGTLQRCLDSFARQTYPHKQLIVIDGGSTDGSQGMLAANEAHLFYWESERDRGIYHAWNKGVARATGDWICFIGSDDYLWADDSLEKMAAHLERTPPEIKVVYGKAAIVSKAGDVLRFDGLPWEQAKKTFCHTLTIPHPGLMHRRSLFEEHGMFDESYKIVGDYDLLLRELKTGEARFASDVTTVAFQHGGVSNSPGAMRSILRELARVRKTHGLLGAQARTFSSVRLKMNLCGMLVSVVGESGFRWIADMGRIAMGRPPIWRENTHAKGRRLKGVSSGVLW